MTDTIPQRASSDGRSLARMGIPGLDEILRGGLPRKRIFLIDGVPGTGKTTLALQFLLEGRAQGERGLYVTLSETSEELQAAAQSHGWSLDGIEIVELSALTGEGSDEAYTLFHPAEVELQQTVEVVLAEIERHQPQRIAFDSLSEMRMLARDPLRFRRQILALKQFFAGRDCTVLLLDDRAHPEGDLQLHSLAHGVILLEHLSMDYGAERRRIQVKKLRGARFSGGYHDFRIRTGGIEVYPRIQRGEAIARLTTAPLESGSRELDALVGGGLERGTSTLLTGAAGTGKSVLAMQFALATAARGEHARVFMFDERVTTAMIRAQGLGLDIRGPMDDGRLVLCQIEPTEKSPGEFAHQVARAVEDENVSLVIIDSINGFMQAMPSEQLLTVQMHELLSYLANRGVSVIMTLVQRGIFGAPVSDAAEVSYLADSVVLLRYFEHSGTVRRAISVVKKRSGAHEQTIREFRVERGGIRVGEPLTDFRGVLTGNPEYLGQAEPLMANDV
ncbi:MAG TPA: ATPase domain-containing protein [Gemmatimonadaceae bacterium]|nr:ATPase domain-containing protein [Gemmatimonadaceae bacterium]